MWTEERCVERLVHWHEHFQRYFRQNAPRPSIGFVVSTAQVQGKYFPYHKTVVLNKTYLMILDDREIDELICHEVAHHWQDIIMPESATHGEFFVFLMRRVCGWSGKTKGGPCPVTPEQRRSLSKMIQFREKINGNDTGLNRWSAVAFNSKSEDGREYRDATE